MNLISNRCLGAYIYRDILKEKYENPFIWTGMYKDDYKYLMEHFEDINFKNFKIKENPYNLPQKTFLGIVIDDKVRVNYSHIRQQAGALKPIIKGTYIFVDDREKYIREKYLERLKRMYEHKPIFVFHDLDDWSLDYRLCDVANAQKKDLRIVTIHDGYKPSEFVKVLKVKKQDWGKVDWWSYIMKNYKEEVSNLFK